jgi:hypothetical protein
MVFLGVAAPSSVVCHRLPAVFAFGDVYGRIGRLSVSSSGVAFMRANGVKCFTHRSARNLCEIEWMRGVATCLRCGFRDGHHLTTFSLNASGRIELHAGFDGCVPEGIFEISGPTETICLGPAQKPIATRHRIHSHPPFHCDPSNGAFCLGPVIRMGYVARRCACNVHNALCNRHGVEPPPVSRSWGASLEWLDVFAATRSWNDVAIAPDDHAAWLAKWPLGKRKQIVSSIDRDLVKPDRLQAMIKRESGHSFPTKARLIQYYPNMATQAYCAPTFYAVQKSIVAWAPTYTHRGVRVTIGSGLNSGGLGRWMSEVHDRFATPWFYERDGKSWDATMQRHHHDLKMRLYRVVDAGFAEFVNAGFKCRGYCFLPDGTFVYTLDGTVKSGHNDTTLGNSIVNAAIALDACVALGLEAEIIVVGDDCLIAFANEPTGVAEYESQCGIVPEARVFRNYLDVTFISGCWVRGAGGYIFLPKLGRLFARLWWAVVMPPAKHLDRYKRGVVAGLMTACRGVPLYEDFLAPALTEGDTIVSRDTALWVSNFGGCAPDDSTRTDLMARYDLLPSEFDALRDLLRSLPQSAVYVRHPLMERVAAVDLADCLDRPLAA